MAQHVEAGLGIGQQGHPGAGQEGTGEVSTADPPGDDGSGDAEQAERHRRQPARAAARELPELQPDHDSQAAGQGREPGCQRTDGAAPSATMAPAATSAPAHHGQDAGGGVYA